MRSRLLLRCTLDHHRSPRTRCSSGKRTGIVPCIVHLGVGAFSFALAREGAHCVVVEADADAVACGMAARGGGPRFVQSDVLRYLRSREGARSRPEVVVADPPRTGLSRGVADAIAALPSNRLVLVSCDPATLARDARDLVRGGFRLERVIPIDLFPQTAEIEAVALLTRSGPA